MREQLVIPKIEKKLLHNGFLISYSVSMNSFAGIQRANAPFPFLIKDNSVHNITRRSKPIKALSNNQGGNRTCYYIGFYPLRN